MHEKTGKHLRGRCVRRLCGSDQWIIYLDLILTRRFHPVVAVPTQCLISGLHTSSCGHASCLFQATCDRGKLGSSWHLLFMKASLKAKPVGCDLEQQGKNFLPRMSSPTAMQSMSDQNTKLNGVIFLMPAARPLHHSPRAEMLLFKHKTKHFLFKP